MDSERVNEIRAALDKLEDTIIQYPEYETPEEVGARWRAEQRFIELADDVRELLAENQRLQAVVEAARVYSTSLEACHTYYQPTQAKFKALLDALAAYEAAGNDE